MNASILPSNRKRFYLNTFRNINHLKPIMEHIKENSFRSDVYQKAIDKAEIKLNAQQKEIITDKDIITALIDGNFDIAKMLYEIGCSNSFTKELYFNHSLDAFTIFALFSEGFYQAAEFLYDLVGLMPEQIDLGWLFMQQGFESFLKATPEAVFFLHKIGRFDNNMLFDYVSIIDLIKAGKKHDFNFMLSLNYPVNKIDRNEITKLIEDENFEILRILFQNFKIKDIGNVSIPYYKIISLIEQQRFDDAKLILDIGASVEDSMIWNFFIKRNIAAIELLAPYASQIEPRTIAAIADRGYYDLASKLMHLKNLSIIDMEQGFIELNFGTNIILGSLIQGNKEKAEKLYKLGAPISNQMIISLIEDGNLEDAKFLMNLKGFTIEEQEALLPKTVVITTPQPELVQIKQVAMQDNDTNIDLTNFDKLKVNLPDQNIGINEAVKSITYYEKSLNKAKIELSIDNLEKSTLFKPILAYYALICLEQQNPIYFYDSSSKYGKIMRHFTGRAHHDGKIEIKSHPISQEGAEEITYNLFTLADEIKDDNPAQLLDRVAAIILSHHEIIDNLDPESTVKEFFESGLVGHESGILFHEITHQVINKVFNSFNPYFIEVPDSQNEHHNAICQTLTNIQTKFLPHHPVSVDACQDLWKFGVELKTTLLGEEKDDDGKMIDIAGIMHGINYFGKAILGYSTLLSAFSKRSYNYDTLDSEFIPRLPELEFFYGTEDAIFQSIAGRKHYCKHVLPVILDAINSHPLAGKIDFEPLEDFSCEQVFL